MSEELLDLSRLTPEERELWDRFMTDEYPFRGGSGGPDLELRLHLHVRAREGARRGSRTPQGARPPQPRAPVLRQRAQSPLRGAALRSDSGGPSPRCTPA